MQRLPAKSCDQTMCVCMCIFPPAQAQQPPPARPSPPLCVPPLRLLAAAPHFFKTGAKAAGQQLPKAALRPPKAALQPPKAALQPPTAEPMAMHLRPPPPLPPQKSPVKRPAPAPPPRPFQKPAKRQAPAPPMPPPPPGWDTPANVCVQPLQPLAKSALRRLAKQPAPPAGPPPKRRCLPKLAPTQTGLPTPKGHPVSYAPP